MEIFPVSSEDRQFSERRIAQAVVDAALICRQELEGEDEVSWQTRQALVDAVHRNPLLTAQLFLPQYKN